MMGRPETVDHHFSFPGKLPEQKEGRWYQVGETRHCFQSMEQKAIAVPPIQEDWVSFGWGWGWVVNSVLSCKIWRPIQLSSFFYSLITEQLKPSDFFF
jgi:hypothetical protein